MDAQQHLILLRDAKTTRFRDKTTEVRECEWVDGRLRVTFGGGKTYTYNGANVDVRTGEPEAVSAGERLAVRGQICPGAISMTRFGDHTRVTRRNDRGVIEHDLLPSHEVQFLQTAAAPGDASAILDYWRALARSLPPGDPTRGEVSALSFVHPESALAAYLHGISLDRLAEPTPALHPFSSNISQRDATEMALSHQISVIEGPPGTGKTQTILNIVASAVAAGELNVAVVSSTNAAVDNVREKLDKVGIGYIAAALGNRDNRTAFLAGQVDRIAAVEAAMRRPPPGDPAPAEAVARVTERLRRAQQADRDRARLESELAAYRVEHRHFVRHVEDREIPPLDALPLLNKASGKILGYLAETSLDTSTPGLLTRVRRYFTYGRTGAIDPGDIDVVLRLQETYYRRRIHELEDELAALHALLELADLEQLVVDHTEASMTRLDRALRDRYNQGTRKVYADMAWQSERDFLTDYPVILSTCHSLARNLPTGHLVDLLIIDEASQVSLLIAAVAMACAKRVVVVGDTRQLPHIPGRIPHGVEPPHPAYDHGRQSLLSSLHALYGEALPSTMLIEHYRCAPEIIGYCNRSFYGGELISFTHAQPGTTSMRVWTTPDGNHMRALSGGRGISNEREIDVIRKDVIPDMGLVGRQVGYITPYRLQADKLAGTVQEIGELGVEDDIKNGLLDVSVRPSTPAPRAQSDTVHKFQGRECDVVVMSSVVDDSWRGRHALRYADDARLINVAVSRAISTFVLVAHHRRHPKSRNLADLIDYITYHDPDAVRESDVVSIFDLLYRDYSQRLAPFAARVRRESRYPSEDLARTLIEDVLHTTDEHDRYRGLAVAPQYRLAHLFTETAAFTTEQQRFLRTTSSVDFLVYRSVSLRPVLAIEVDGWAFHENKPEQLERDRVKDSIFHTAGLPLPLRLSTTGSEEGARIRTALDAALEHATPESLVLSDARTGSSRSDRRPGRRAARAGSV
ncbi:AAA domain-containing protein [Agilicoccus flavus]|uniref:AAA domain-containing protein n=1 Tax=Agilicoccus flavus TaxID=2775968 RepID=UPI001CF65A26|nr:AAA domain-containing protein [Agilicoccus flavus]